MNLDRLVEEIKNFEGIKRKRAVKSVKILEPEASTVLSSIGEDAGALHLDEKAILLTCEGIWKNLIEADPFWAGYCAVIANVNDLLAMGGKPVAMVNVLSGKNFKKAMLGIKEGSEKYGIPVIGGHVNPEGNDFISVSMIGLAKKRSLIPSNRAKEGDKIIVAIDLRGRVHPSFDLNWDSITMRTRGEIKDLMNVLMEIGEEKLATSGKDISNQGLIGTIGILCELSKKGARIDLEKIPRPNVELVHWLKVYPGFGFVLCAEKNKSSKCMGKFIERGVSAREIGTIDRSMKIKIAEENKEKVVFDLEKECITGLIGNKRYSSR